MNYFNYFIIRFWVIWNIILAVLPSGFWNLAQYFKTRKITLLYWLNIILMILFLPNSIYLTTDFIHIFSSVPESFYAYGGTPAQLYDFIDPNSVSFGWLYNSVMVSLFFLGIYLFWDQSKLLFKEFKLNAVSRSLFFILMAYGVYLGRFVRLNSWDVFMDFFGFINQIIPSLQGILFILAFAVFEAVSCFILDRSLKTRNNIENL